MIRFAFPILLFLSLVGCQTAEQRPKPSFTAHAPQSAKQLWGKTARLFHKSDTGKRNADSSTLFADYRDSANFMPVNNSSLSLYKAGSITSPLLALQETDEPELEATAIVAEISSSYTEDPEALKNPLQESEAPFPDEEFLAEIRRPAKRTPSQREMDWEDFDEDLYDEPRPAMKRTLPKREAPVVAQTSMSQEISSLQEPKYPSLTQLPHAVPGMIQAGYQQNMSSYAHNVPNYGVSGYGAGDWQTPTRQAIEQLRYAIEQTPNGRTLSNEMKLRTLETLLGNKAEAARSIQSADKTVSEFFRHQVLGLATLLDDTIPDDRGRYVSAAYRFNEGLAELQNLCPLKLKKVLFVENFFDYGQYLLHPTNEYKAGESFLVYIELENPKVKKTPDGFEVSVAVSFEIRDENANIVIKQDADKAQLSTASRKRDYNLGVGPIKLPPTLSPGLYQLKISIIDLNGDALQCADEQIPFRIIPALAGE